MKYQIHRAVVIGAGTMGAAVAAHLANAGVPVTLLDIVPHELTPNEQERGLSLADPKVRNRIVREGLQAAVKSKPASFFSRELDTLVTIGNLEDNFDAIGQADWVVEAIIENLDIKRALMARIDAIRSPHTIVSTNTSGIPVASITEGLSIGFREHFLGTHFFNPPRYLKLLEVIPTADTLPGVVEFISRFGEFRLGKGIVPAKDTPNFIGNRLFAGWVAFQMDYILEHQYTVPEVDAVTGPPIGHPKTATFRLFDLIGMDVWAHVSKNLAPLISHDELAVQYMSSERVKDLITTMVANGWFGNKTKQGFYKQVKVNGKKEFWPLDFKLMEHVKPTKPRFESIRKAKDEPDLGERLKIIMAGDDRASELVRTFTYQSLFYAAHLIPEIADTPKPMDDATRWGFGHQAGPFEIWDLLGVAETKDAMETAGFTVPDWVVSMLEAGFDSFYECDGPTKVAVYNPDRKQYDPIAKPRGMVILDQQKASGNVIKRNPGASLIDIGDGVACVEFHTKMNALDDDIIAMIIEGLDRTEREFDGLVIGNEADNFSAGANLFMVVMAAQNGMWDQLEAALKRGQETYMRMRYFPKPVVVAPAGLALGGGAEMPMHASRVVAAAELYTGLVEFGVGVIPAWGGTKEMLRRIVNPAMRTPNPISLPYLQRAFEQIGFAKVATSAVEAREMGLLSPNDRIVMNRDYLLTEAKREVLHMIAAGYTAPLPEKIFAAGRDALGALRVSVFMLREGKFISDHDKLIAQKLGSVLTGGELSQPAWVSEQFILDLEREAFLSLCGTEKTQERLWHTLQTGKPLRN